MLDVAIAVLGLCAALMCLLGALAAAIRWFLRVSGLTLRSIIEEQRADLARQEAMRREFERERNRWGR